MLNSLNLWILITKVFFQEVIWTKLELKKNSDYTWVHLTYSYIQVCIFVDEKKAVKVFIQRYLSFSTFGMKFLLVYQFNYVCQKIILF